MPRRPTIREKKSKAGVRPPAFAGASSRQALNGQTPKRKDYEFRKK